MKDIRTFIREALEQEELNEGKETFVKFKLFGCDESKKAYENVAGAAQSAGIYFEKIDNDTFKLKLKPGQDISKIKEILNGLIDGIPEDKQEELAEQVDKLKQSISKADEAVKEDEEDPEKKEEE